MRLLPLLACTSLLSGAVSAAPDANEPRAATTAFTVSGLECGSCLYMVQHTLSRTPGVTDVEMIQSFEDFAVVTYDPRVLSEHQIAQAVREAPALHAMPYIATIRLRAPDYAREGCAAKWKALFEPWKEWVELAVLDEREGVLLIQFQELLPGAQGGFPRGWSLADLRQALSKHPELKFELVNPEPL